MANARIRSASIFLNQKKMGTIEGIKYTYSTGDEDQFGDPGYIGASDGAATSSISCNGIVPLPGMEMDIMAAMQNKADFDIALGVVNGKIHQVTMRGKKCEFTGSQKAGTLMGDFEFSGGEVSITG